MTAVSNLVDCLKVGLAQLNALKVGLDTLGVGTLGEHDVAAADTPGNQHLSQGVTALLSDLVQSLVVGDALAGGGHLVLRAQGRVGLGHDVVGETVLHQLAVGQEGVDLDLVDLRLHLGKLGHLLQLGDGPVGDTDGPGLAVGVQLLHGAPCLLVVLGQILQDHVLCFI